MFRFTLRRVVLLPVLLLLINAIGYMMPTYLVLRAQSIFGNVDFTQVIEGYPEYLLAVLRGDWGTLPTTDSPITSYIAGALPRSLLLLFLALLVAAIIGMTVGFLSVNRQIRRTNLLALTLSLGGFSMPSFYLGIVVIYLMFLLSAWTGTTGTLLPAFGYGLDEHLILPTLVLAVRPSAEIARITSDLLAEELGKEYIRVARAKGLPWRLVMTRHAFRNILSAVIITLGNSMRYVVSSLLIVESLFSWHGVGDAMVSAMTGRGNASWMFNPPLLAALMTVVALLFLIANLITDISARVIDPRLKR